MRWRIFLWNCNLPIYQTKSEDYWVMKTKSFSLLFSQWILSMVWNLKLYKITKLFLLLQSATCFIASISTFKVPTRQVTSSILLFRKSALLIKGFYCVWRPSDPWERVTLSGHAVVCVYVCVYIYVCVCVCVIKYLHTFKYRESPIIRFTVNCSERGLVHTPLLQLSYTCN